MLQRLFSKLIVALVVFVSILHTNIELNANPNHTLLGNGSQTEPYLIQNQDDLIILSDMVFSGYNTYGKYFVLDSDIYINSEIPPIGTASNPFMGTFYSDEHSKKSIYNLKINNNEEYTALFSFIHFAKIENINLVNVDISGDGFTSGLVAYASFSEIINCSVSGNISGGYGVSGLVFVLEDSKVANSSSLTNISGDSMLGGFAGIMFGNSSHIHSSFFSGKLSSYATNLDFAAGGFIAYLSDGIIEESFAHASIKSPLQTNQIGGFVSQIDSGIIRNSYASGTIDSDQAAGFVYHFLNGNIFNSYSAIRISGNDFYSGFVSIADSGSNFENCFFDESINSGYAFADNENINGITKLTTFEMSEDAEKHMADFSGNLWYFTKNNGSSKHYPQLNAFNNSESINHSNKSSEVGLFYSVRFMIPFEFNTTDKNLINQLIAPGQSAKAPAISGPDIELFVGWSVNENSSSSEYGASQINNISQNLVLYPVFSARQTFRIIYTSLNADGGNAPTDTNEYKSGDLATILPNSGTLFKALHEFEGWRDASNKLYLPGEKIVINEGVRLNPSWKSTNIVQPPTPPPTINNIFPANSNIDSSDSFLKLAEILLVLNANNKPQADTKVRLDTEISLNKVENLNETRTEMSFKFSIELPYELLKK